MSDDNALLLVIEDEPQMRRLLRPSLTGQGFKLVEVGTAAEGLSAAQTHAPELILLDLGLPDCDGVDLTRSLRRWTKVPIIVISARGRDADKVEALDAGADDYLTKPFGVIELLARIRVAFRHAQAAGPAQLSSVLECGNVQLDTERREVRVDDRLIHLSPIEYKVLELLMRNAGKVLTHAQILEHVWGTNQERMSHHVVVHMAELRKKIERDQRRPQLLLTESGVGYRMRDTAAQRRRG